MLVETGKKMISKLRRFFRQGKVQVTYLLLMSVLFGGLFTWRMAHAQNQLPANLPPGAKTEISGAPMAAARVTEHSTFHYFGFWNDPKFSSGERAALFVSLLVALAALAYAGMLV